MMTKTRIGNYLRRHMLGDQPTFRQGFKEGVAFAQKHATPPASKPWVGLTMNQLKSGSQIEEAKSSATLDLSKAFWAGARWAEAKLREKNNG